METTFTKADLHVHSKFSKRPSLWVLQKLGCPESYTEPHKLYEIASRKGMSLITITDHNSIEGCLEIAHLPGVFVSEEVTAAFPEDGCQIHVLVYNIAEAQHAEIQRLRENVMDLVNYLNQQAIPHSLAHALYPVNDRLTRDHFERLLLLFKNFELNGAREAHQNQCLAAIIRSLTPSLMEKLAEKHGMSPAFPDAWIKNFTGGSDDHSSLNIANTHTQVSGNFDITAFFQALQSGQTEVCGRASTPLMLAHNIYGIAYQYYARKTNLERHARRDPLVGFLSQSLQPTPAGRPAKGVFSQLCRMWRHRKQHLLKGALNLELQDLLERESHQVIHSNPELLASASAVAGPHPDMDRKWFTFVNHVTNGVLHHFANQFLEHAQRANVFRIFESIGSAGGLYSLLAPYFIAFSVFSHGRNFSNEAQKWFPSSGNFREAAQPIQVAHFTDTLYEINGVALTLRQQAKIAGRTNKRLKIITCGEHKGVRTDTILNFQPIGVYELPEYPEQKLFLPPFLEILEYCYEERFTHIHSATPGPMGLAALGVARILKLPIHGTYHTALPQYARFLTNDPTVEDLVWRYTLWYYDQMDRVFVPSLNTARELTDKGIPRDKIRVFPRGIDIQRFNPSVQNGYLKNHHPALPAFQLLYVGRVSREKGLPLLANVFKSLQRASSLKKMPLHLVVVGDGPYLQEMRKSMEGYPCTFTGYLEGDDLVSVYNSCDLFVFPSTTDTFGNVVLEAQACGLPAVVSDCGGPQENVLNGATGVVFQGGNELALRSAIESLLEDPQRLRKMSRAARRYMEERSFELAFHDTWNMYEDSSRGSLGTLDEAV